ncbi:MAG: hypothetical protein QOH21_3238 [Acidobacteriota bacterium]|jgi:hypothetical protein|nr:hypothetical protein [Acidobacteriota bacterium]
MQTANFQSALTAPGRSPEIPEQHDAYGWLIGSWDLDIPFYRVDISDRRVKGQVHFSWVLEGRAVQDVWIMPHSYGTTLRIWDPAIEAWRVTWINPISGVRDQLIGRRSGSDIIQLGTHADDTPIRWTFTEITDHSFRWLGDALEPDGVTWKREAEFRATRMHA